MRHTSDRKKRLAPWLVSCALLTAVGGLQLQTTARGTAKADLTHDGELIAEALQIDAFLVSTAGNTPACEAEKCLVVQEPCVALRAALDRCAKIAPREVVSTDLRALHGEISAVCTRLGDMPDIREPEVISPSQPPPPQQVPNESTLRALAVSVRGNLSQEIDRALVSRGIKEGGR